MTSNPPQACANRLGCFDHLLSSVFKKLGYQVGKRPGYYIITTTLVFALFSTGLQRLKLVLDIEYLYTPEGSQSKIDKKLIETTFHLNLSQDFDIGRKTSMGKWAVILILPTSADSVLNVEVFNAISSVDQYIQQISIQWDEEVWTYKDICAKKSKNCYKNDYLSLGPKMSRLESGNETIPYPIHINRYTFVLYAANLGGVTVDDKGRLRKATAVRLLYFLDDSTPRRRNLATLWEEELSNKLPTAQFDNITVSVWATTSLEKEMHNLSIGAFPIFVGNFFIVLGFTVLTCLSTDWVKSKPWVGVCGGITSTISTGAAFGLLSYCGLPFIDMDIAIPFLLLGIGMDDTFVMLAAWGRTDSRLSVAERLSLTYSEAAVAITITSMTNFASFLVGIITPLPCVFLFCTYAACAVILVYICQITFFGACLAISGYAEYQNLHGIFCLPVKHISLAAHRSFFYRYFWTGGPDPLIKDKKQGDIHDRFLSIFFRDYLGVALTKIPVQVLVIILFVCYIAIASWGCYNIEQGINFRLLHPYTSHVVKYYDIMYQYFNEYEERVQIIINQPLDYWEPKVQEDMENLLRKFESCKHMSKISLTESWLRHYLNVTRDRRTSTLFTSFNLTSRGDFFEGLERIFFHIPIFSHYKYDVVFSPNKTAIVASRFIVQAVGKITTQEKKEMLMDLRGIAASFPYDVRVYHPNYLFYDQFMMVADTTMKSVSVAAALTTAVSAFFLPRITYIVVVTLSILSIEAGIIGYMSFWSVNLDGVSMVNLIMCIGFSVDFIAHISHAYNSTPDNEHRAEKLKRSLYLVGLPIIQGGISTVLGIVLLIEIPAYIFTVFVKLVFLVVLLSVLHAIILLPILFSLLSCCGRKAIQAQESLPASNEEQQNDENKKENPAKKLARRLSQTISPLPYASLEEPTIRPTLKRRLSSPANFKYKEGLKEYVNSAFMPDVFTISTVDECDEVSVNNGKK